MVSLPPTTIDAVSATIVAGGRARIPFNMEVDVNKLISNFFNQSNKILRWRPQKRHAQGRPPLEQRGFIKSTLLKGRAAPLPW